MASESNLKRAKDERKAVYFDLTCGVISSIIALTGIVYTLIKSEITRPAFFITGFIFWICYLSLAFFLICLGIYLWYQEKYFEEKKSKKKIKAPIV